MSTEDSTGCIPEEPSEQVQTATTAMTSILGAGVGINLINAVLGSSSPQASLNMVNAVQLLLLLPLIGSYLPIDIIQFIRSMNFSLFDFEFLSLEGNPETEDDVSNVSFEQKNPFLYLIGLESGSSMINLVAVCGLFSIVPVIHAIISIIHFILSCKKVNNCFSKIVKRVFKELTFGVYVRFLYEIYLFLVLASISEINQFENRHVIRRISLLVASIVSLFCVMFMTLSVYQWTKAWNQPDLEEMVYFVEFFAGIKGNRKARSYSLMFLLRRTVLCLVVIFINIETLFHTKIAIFFFFQL